MLTLSIEVLVGQRSMTFSDALGENQLNKPLHNSFSPTEINQALKETFTEFCVLIYHFHAFSSHDSFTVMIPRLINVTKTMQHVNATVLQ